MKRRSQLVVAGIASLATLALGAAAVADSHEGGMAMPKPTEHHELLMMGLGTWEATVTTFGPDGKSNESKGWETVTRCCGGMWTVSEFRSGSGDKVFEGRGLTGYDEKSGKYVSVWVDSGTGRPMNMEGTYDKDAKTVTMTSDAPDMAGKMTTWTFTTKYEDDGSRTFTGATPGPDGEPVTVMVISYTKKTEVTRMSDKVADVVKDRINDARTKAAEVLMPTGKGPVTIETKDAGPMKLKAGQSVLIWSNGKTYSGTISAVDERAVAIGDVVLAAKDIDRVHKLK